MRAGWGALCAGVAWSVIATAACGHEADSPALAEGSPADAAHRGDTGPLGGPVLDASVVCPSIGQLLEPWDGIDEERWSELRDPATSTCAVAVSAGLLDLTSDGATVECGLISAGCYDLTDRALVIDAAVPGDGAPEPFLRVALAGGGALEMRVAGAERLQVLRDGEPVASTALDPAAHRLWRMHHTAVAGRVDYQAAPLDSTDWVTLASSEVVADDITVVQVAVGVSGAGAAGDAVQFDNLVGVDF